MKVSIVTISYNQAPFLERAIRSVVEQDYADIEYILVDAGSSDASHAIIERYADQIAQIVIEPDDGPPDGLNKGFARAHGDILAYINADDALLPGAVGAAVQAFQRMPEADVVVGHGYIVDGEGRVLRRFRSAPFSLWRFAHGAATVMQQSTFFRRAIFEKAGGFDTGNVTSWDAELLLDMGLAGAKVRLAEGYWSIFTMHAQSISGSQRLAHESQKLYRRYFRKAMGRERKPIDRLWDRVAWAIRWLIDPIGLVHRLRDRLLGPPRRTFG